MIHYIIHPKFVIFTPNLSFDTKPFNYDFKFFVVAINSHQAIYLMATNKVTIRAQKACFLIPIYTEMTPMPKLQLTAIELMHLLFLIADSTDMSTEFLKTLY